MTEHKLTKFQFHNPSAVFIERGKMSCIRCHNRDGVICSTCHNKIVNKLKEKYKKLDKAFSILNAFHISTALDINSTYLEKKQNEWYKRQDEAQKEFEGEK